MTGRLPSVGLGSFNCTSGEDDTDPLDLEVTAGSTGAKVMIPSLDSSLGLDIALFSDGFTQHQSHWLSCLTSTGDTADKLQLGSRL